MIYRDARILPAGDASVLIEWADEINEEANDRVHAFAQLLHDQSHHGISDLVPAYSSLLVCFDPSRLSTIKLQDILLELLRSPQANIEISSRLIEIPVRYGGQDGPDLGFVADHSALTEEQVIHLHDRVTYRVYMIGFAPGFAYLGPVRQEISVPRLTTPRVRVPAGSVGLAGRQTGIYPMETPGGWRLIGRTDERLFDAGMDPPALLRPGDRVRFVAI